MTEMDGGASEFIAVFQAVEHAAQLIADATGVPLMADVYASELWLAAVDIAEISAGLAA